MTWYSKFKSAHYFSMLWKQKQNKNVCKMTTKKSAIVVLYEKLILIKIS